jgi:AraC-like DNA-binding protein
MKTRSPDSSEFPGPGETVDSQDVLSTLLNSLDMKCSSVDAISINHSNGTCIYDLGPVFYVVTDGSCRFDCPDAKPVALGRDDLLVLCQGGKHGLSHVSSSPSSHRDNGPRHGTSTTSSARNDDQTVLLRGRLTHLTPQPHPLWLGLPDVVHLKNVTADRSDPILAGAIRSLRHLLAKRPDGSDAIMGMLGRLLVLETLRKMIDRPDLAGAGISRVLSDPELAPVLAQVYRDPSRQWTLLALANEAGISRSSFARRFKQLSELSLSEWIADLRMRRAQGLLANPNLGLEQVARTVGYSNAASFSVAFKRWAGHYPSLRRGR